MPSFTSDKFSNFYKRILQIGNSDNSGVSTSLTNVQAGDGTATCLSIADDDLLIRPQNDNTTGTFNVRNAGGSHVLNVDTTNKKVLVGSEQVATNTNYAIFGVTANQSGSHAAGYHYALSYHNAVHNVSAQPPEFGNSANPATSFTTADSSANRASDIVQCMWYVHDAITIDAVRAIIGADAATGDDVNMHINSYDFTSGATNCLTNGTELASSATITSAGSEQPYLSSAFTIASADVAAGKVIMAFFEPVSINSDYTVSIQIKYHIQ